MQRRNRSKGDKPTPAQISTLGKIFSTNYRDCTITCLDIARTPSAGMVFCNGKQKGDKIPISFIYFREYEKPYMCKPNAGRVFAVYISYDVDREFSDVVEYFVSIQGDEISLCRTRQNGFKYIQSRSAGKRGPMHTIRIPQFRWGYSDKLQEVARENDVTPEELAIQIFLFGASAWHSSTDDGLVIRCNDGKTVATFNVDTKRTPYFFKDRITALAADGKRKRIFHCVKAHARDIGDDTNVKVKAHYRGERHFRWGGDKVSITVPGLHHGKKWTDFNVKAHLLEDEKQTSKYLTASQVGDRLVQHLEK